MNYEFLLAQRKRYRIIVPVAALITLLLFFLPFVNYGDVSITGFDLFKSAIGLSSVAEADLIIKSYGGLKVIFIFEVIALLAVAVLGVFHKKITYRLATVFSVVPFISFLFTFFSISVKVTDAFGLDSPYMVKNLGFAFWLTGIFSIAVIATTLKALKTTTAYIGLSIMAVIWILPLLWVIMTSFREEKGSYTSYFFPKELGFGNYKALFTDTNILNFPQMFINTLIVSIFVCVISTFFVVSVSFCMSRLRFKVRKPFMNLAMILGLFPGFMSMVAVYFILKAFGLTEGGNVRIALIIVYSAGTGMGFYMCKGYMDTISKSLDESAVIDGATKFQIFRKITLPLSKPIIVHTILTSFMSPWLDFIFAKVICGAKTDQYTVAIGMWNMLTKEYIHVWYTRFAAAAVLVSIPIATVFLIMQKFYNESMSGAVKG